MTGSARLLTAQACLTSAASSDAEQLVRAVFESLMKVPAPADTSCGWSGAFIDLPDYRGLTEEAASTLAATEHRRLRIIGRAGSCGPVTTDYSPERVDAYLLKDGRIAWASLAG
jgi:hypothetical protein